MSTSASPLTLSPPTPSALAPLSPGSRDPDGTITAQSNPPDAIDPPGKAVHWKRFWQGERGQQLSSTLASTLVHMLAVLILALWLAETPHTPTARTLLLSIDKPTEDLPLSSEANSIEPIVTPEIMAGPPVVPQQLVASNTPVLPANDTPFIEVPRSTTPAGSAVPESATSVVAAQPVLGGLNGKDRRARRTRALDDGATHGSEDAVEQALLWLSRHQRKDGSWRFDHHDGACDGSCRNPGNHASTTASTAFPLLCFYGAGYSHTEGQYAETINRGLYYLGGRLLLTQEGGDLQEGTMYAQGIATIALCEAAAMTDDPTLRGYGERAIQFILYAQDKKGGGWRYHPGEPGDTTVTGWQLMALKSAQMSGIAVPSPAFDGANHFLDSVQSRNGALYGYQNQQPRNSTTAVGLLGRMYLGWKQDNAALREGVLYLDKQGPSKNDLYYNYYATQVMRHYGGEPWKRWNTKMREYLIATQARNGHETGSWYFPEQHNDQGGRLLNTCLATMTLEVYYRYQPLYKQNAATSGF